MQNLRSILLEIRVGDSTSISVNSLIKICTRFALTIANNNLTTQRINNSNILITDLAIDAIAPLFIKDKSGELPIRKALLNWDKEINDEASANYFLYKIISNRIEQEIAQKLKEADPFFGKILRSINHLVDTNRLKKISWFGMTYLVEPETDSIKQKPFEPEFLENLSASLFQGTNLSVVTKLFDYIKKETDYFPAVPLNALIRKIKHVNGSFLQYAHPGYLAESFDETLNVEKVITESLNKVYDRLDKFYYRKGKFDNCEVEILRKVITELSSDLHDGGISRGLYDYLTPHMEDLSKEYFYKKYHQPLDYLLRLLKKEIAERLEETSG